VNVAGALIEHVLSTHRAHSAARGAG
jgi:hypothetical protein